MRDAPADLISDPTINHVGRSWSQIDGGSGSALQAIWRAYTDSEAKGFYQHTLNSLYPQGTLPADIFFVEFKPPKEIHFTSQMADEFYIACGWNERAYCEVLARYRNYVSSMQFELEAEYQGHTSDGLTYEEIESIVRAMDAKFVEFFASFATPTP